MRGKTYLCTGNIVVHWKTCVHWKIYLCTGNIFVHWESYLCTGILISALENIFVHWKIYLCSGKLICALKNIFVHWKYIFTLGNLLVHWKTYLCTENIYFCTQKHVRNVFRSIYMHWNFHLCIAYMGHRSFCRAGLHFTRRPWWLTHFAQKPMHGADQTADKKPLTWVEARKKVV